MAVLWLSYDESATSKRLYSSEYLLLLSKPCLPNCRDLKTGSIHNIWYGLTYGLTMISAPMGTYPSFAFSPQDDAVIIWAAGQIYRVPLAINKRGERVAGSAPHPIPFTAHIEKRLAETLRGGNLNLVELETAPTQRARAFKELQVDETGGIAVFQAAGTTYLTNVGEKNTTQRVPVLHPDQPYYSPSFVHGAPDLILHARWSDTHFTTFEISNVASKQVYELEGLPMGRYYSPILCECESADRQIAFIKSGGDLLTGDSLATAKPGLYIGSLTLPSSAAKHGTAIPIRNVTFVRSAIAPEDRLSMRFLEGNKKLLVHQSSTSFIIDIAGGPDRHGNYAHQTLARGEMSTELGTSVARMSDGSFGVEHVAFVDFFHIYLVPGSSVKEREAVWSKPANATKGLARLSVDGKKLFWFSGKPSSPCFAGTSSYQFSQDPNFIRLRSPGLVDALRRSVKTI